METIHRYQHVEIVFFISKTHTMFEIIFVVVQPKRFFTAFKSTVESLETTTVKTNK